MEPGLPSPAWSLRFNLSSEVVLMDTDPNSRMRPEKEGAENNVSA
jgi:hypothetical protein